MKPRTKLQWDVHELMNTLPNRLRQMEQWARDSISEPIGFATKARILCMECGETFVGAAHSSAQQKKRTQKARCPHCDRKLTIEASRKTTHQQTAVLAFAEPCGSFQVVRIFQVDSHHRAGQKATASAHELLQHWVLDDGRREVTSVAQNSGGVYCVGRLEIRPKTMGGSYYEAVRDITPEVYHPQSHFREKWRKIGFTPKIDHLSFIRLARLVEDNPRAETLLKAHRYNMLAVMDTDYRINHHWPSVRIALRTGYQPTSVRMWLDLLEMLRLEHKDLHNSHYVCPKNLQEAHDYWMKKRNKAVQKERKERERKRAIADQATYEQSKSAFFSFTVSEGDLTISVPRLVSEIQAEGEALHHCVFTANYHLKADSLILFARISDTRAETVEVNLVTGEILQSRGLLNQNSPYHQQIINTVSRAIPQLMEISKQQHQKTA